MVPCVDGTMIYCCAHIKHMDFTFPDLDASSLKEKVMTEKNGLTQWKDGENLVIQVENPMKEVLSLYWYKILKMHFDN